jgi:hypothetical protein
MSLFFRFSLLAACFLLAILAGCVSPLDTDTPRLRYDDRAIAPPTHRIPAKYFVITARDVMTQTDWKVVVNAATAEIDTTVHPVAVWLNADVTREITSATPVLPFLYAFLFHVDSLIASNKTISFQGEPVLSGGAMLTLVAERDSSNGAPRSITLFPNVDSNLMTLRLESGGTQNLISGVMSINLNTHRVQVEAKLTIRY